MLRLTGTHRRCAMDQTEVVKNKVAANTQKASSPYVPPLQRTAGQPPPIAANGGLSYMAFDRDGDGGTRKALEDALALIETKWGLGFRKYDECMDHMRRTNAVKAPEGGFALPLPYTVYERHTYSVVPSNAIWRDPSRPEVAALL